MSSESPVIDRAEIERVLCQVAEIDAARVVGTDDDLIQEIHILASQKKAARQIVRDIESLLLTTFGLTVDHKKISIAQINKENDSPALRADARLQITNISLSVNCDLATVEVNLTSEGTTHIGSVAGPASPGGQLKSAALAAIDAAGKHLNDNINCTLEDIAVVPISSGKIALSCISVMTPIGDKMLAGSSVVKTNEHDAVVRATLAAINRHIAQDIRD